MLRALICRPGRLVVAASAGAAGVLAAAAFGAITIGYSPGVGSPAPYSYFEGLVGGDFDGDGIDDVAGGTEAGLAVLKASATGQLTPFASSPEPGGDREMVAANLDGDGDVDLAVAEGNGEVHIFKNNGSADFAAPLVETGANSEPQPTDLDRTDLDGDGDSDLILLSVDTYNGGATVSIFVNDGTGNFSEPAESPLVFAFNAPGVASVATGDFDGDGDDDMALNRVGEATIYASDDDGTFTLVGPEPFGDSSYSLVAGDVTGDGDPDLVAYSPDDDDFTTRVRILKGGTGLDFALAGTVDTNDDEGAVLLLADFDGSGRKDIAVFGKTLKIFAVDGAGATDQIGSNPIANGDRAAAVTIGGDANRDIAVVNYDFDSGDARLHILLSGPPTPGGTTTGTTTTGTGTGPTGTTGTTGTTPPAGPGSTPPTSSPVGGNAALPVFKQVVVLPSGKSCTSRRKFRINVKLPKNLKATSATVLVNGRKKKTVLGSKLSAPVDLRGLPKGKFTVTIRILLSDGQVIRGSRAYKTCTKKKRK